MTRTILSALSAAAIAAFATTGALAADAEKPGDKPAVQSAPTMPSGSSQTGNEEIALAAQELQGQDVYSTAGDKIAQIEEVIPETGTAREVVLSVGGLMGIGDKLVLIPATAVDKQTDGRLVIAMSREQLESLPKYEPGETMPAK